VGAMTKYEKPYVGFWEVYMEEEGKEMHKHFGT